MYLVDKLINDVPEPLVWQLQGGRPISICLESTMISYSCCSCTNGSEKMYGQYVLLTENVVEEVAVIVVGLKSLVQSWSTLIIQKIFFSNQIRESFLDSDKKDTDDCSYLAATHADFSVDVSVIEFFVENEKHGICKTQETKTT